MLENIVRFIFGNDLRGYDLPIRRDWQWGPLRIGPQQVENLVIAVIAMTAVFLFLASTRTGKAMRAVADDPTLANLKGIDPERVARLTNFGAMGLAGIGGMLLGLDTSIDPLTGFRVILSVFAAAVVGGLGCIPGAVVGALTIGVAEELSLLSLAPAYRSAVGFCRHPARSHPPPPRPARRARVLTNAPERSRMQCPSVLLDPPPEAGWACGGGTGTRSRPASPCAPTRWEPSQGRSEAASSLVVPAPPPHAHPAPAHGTTRWRTI